jgi:hypothetical protein
MAVRCSCAPDDGSKQHPKQVELITLSRTIKNQTYMLPRCTEPQTKKIINIVLRCASFADRVFPCALFTESYNITHFVVSNDGVSIW